MHCEAHRDAHLAGTQFGSGGRKGETKRKTTIWGTPKKKHLINLIYRFVFLFYVKQNGGSLYLGDVVKVTNWVALKGFCQVGLCS